MASVIPSKVLSTKDLTIGYTEGSKSNPLFTNLNLSLQSGQLVCFMGPNGIGKSTLIRTLSGLQKPLKGEIVYSKETAADALSKKISLVLTDRITATNMTVYELLTFGRYPYLDWSIKLHEKDKTIIEHSIELVRIQHLRNKRLYELSDGQLQMAMIARALTQDGEIILLDEPTAHLDLNNRVEIMNLLRKLSRTTNKAILVATHELDLALQTADLIWLAGRNKNMITGIPEDLVLNGSFDEIFQFKGFDLKTGKVQHEAHRNIRVHLMGDGYEYLWTKNALERCGFEVVSESTEISIQLIKENGKLHWSLRKEDDLKHLDSLSALISLL